MDGDEIVRVLRAFEVEGLEHMITGASRWEFMASYGAAEDVDLVRRRSARVA